MLCNCQGQLLLFVLIMIQPLQPKPNYITIVNFYACSVQYIPDVMTVYPSSTFPPPTQVTVAIIGAVVAAVVVLVGGSVVVAASLIAWKVRSTKASTGMHCTVVHICLCG